MAIEYSRLTSPLQAIVCVRLYCFGLILSQRLDPFQNCLIMTQTPASNPIRDYQPSISIFTIRLQIMMLHSYIRSIPEALLIRKLCISSPITTTTTSNQPTRTSKQGTSNLHSLPIHATCCLIAPPCIIIFISALHPTHLPLLSYCLVVQLKECTQGRHSPHPQYR